MIASAAAIQQRESTRLVLEPAAGPGRAVFARRAGSRSARFNRTTLVPSASVRADALQRPLRGLRRPPVVEEAVDRGTGPADVGAEGAERRAAPRRAASDARSFGGSAARSRGRRTAVERVEQRVRRSSQPSRAVALVEGGVDATPSTASRRRAAATSRIQKSCGSSSGARIVPSPVPSLRAVGEEERDVRAEPGGELVQLLLRQRLVERLVREPERRRRVGAAAAEAGGDGDALLDRRAPALLDRRVRGEPSRAHRGRACRPRTRRRACCSAGSIVDAVGEADALVDGHQLVLAVARAPARRRARG